MPDISFENVSYVPLLLVYGVDIGRHNGMILPNRSSNGNKSSGFGLEKSLYLKTKQPFEGYFHRARICYLSRKKKIAVTSAKRAAITEKVLFILDMSPAIWAMLTNIRKPDNMMNLKSFLVSFCVMKKRPDEIDNRAGIEYKEIGKSDVN